MNYIAQSEILGTIAFKNQLPRVPHSDKELCKLIDALSTPDFKNHSLIIKCMKVWLKNWDLANLAS